MTTASLWTVGCALPHFRHPEHFKSSKQSFSFSCHKQKKKVGERCCEPLPSLILQLKPPNVCASGRGRGTESFGFIIMEPFPRPWWSSLVAPVSGCCTKRLPGVQMRQKQPKVLLGEQTERSRPFSFWGFAMLNIKKAHAPAQRGICLHLLDCAHLKLLSSAFPPPLNPGFSAATSMFTFVVLIITIIICLSHVCFGHFKYLSAHNYKVTKSLTGPVHRLQLHQDRIPQFVLSAQIDSQDVDGLESGPSVCPSASVKAAVRIHSSVYWRQMLTDLLSRQRLLCWNQMSSLSEHKLHVFCLISAPTANVHRSGTSRPEFGGSRFGQRRGRRPGVIAGRGNNQRAERPERRLPVWRRQPH